MRTICLYFQIHQPFRLRRYRFFDIGNEHYYYDDYLNESIMHKVSDKCYLPANKLMLELINKYPGKFKLSFSISGIALDQFELYAPEVIDSFRELANTGQVEFLSETYTHSLVALKDADEFKRQVEKHKNKMIELFNYEPKVFRNTELIYSDEIGATVASMGYKGMLTEGAKHILGWKSPNFLYANAINPRLKVLLKNYKLSDDIAFRFSNKSWSDYPLTSEKFVSWLKNTDKNDDTINLFMDYETFGEHQWEETGIFEFMRALPAAVFKHSKFTFSTPSELVEELQPVAAVNVPNPISWADEERDLTAWLGNPMQEQAFNKLYSLLDKVNSVEDQILKKDFSYLEVSDHFYYMCTKFFSDGDVHQYFTPFDTPYEAFINYMNILSDFEIRLNAALADGDNSEVMRLSKIIAEKDEQIHKIQKQLLALQPDSMLRIEPDAKEQKRKPKVKIRDTSDNKPTPSKLMGSATSKPKVSAKPKVMAKPKVAAKSKLSTKPKSDSKTKK
jgi:alpha-amylase